MFRTQSSSSKFEKLDSARSISSFGLEAIAALGGGEAGISIGEGARGAPDGAASGTAAEALGDGDAGVEGGSLPYKKWFYGEHHLIAESRALIGSSQVQAETSKRSHANERSI